MNRREFLRSVAAGAAISSLLSPAPWARAAQKARPNILLLMVDQWRGDALGAAGNPVVKTPNLDALAREGVLFTAAYSAMPSCTPARATLLTGLSPWHHGMLGYGTIKGEYKFELPKALGAAGYHTCVLGKTHYTPMKATHGFDEVILDQDPKTGNPEDGGEYQKWFAKVSGGKPQNPPGVSWNDYKDYVYAYPEEWHPMGWMGRTAVDLIGRFCAAGKPFFLKVSFTRPHSPYDPPARVLEQYKVEDMPAPYVGEWAARYAAVEHPAPLTTWHGDLGVEQAKKSRRSYYGSITYLDEQVGRIVQALKEKGIYENTLILFTSDHGDMAGDHHLWRKTYAYEGSARIPLIVRWPEALGGGGRRGRVLRQPVELRDVLPTFLDAAGAEIPKFLDGASMLKLVRDERAPWREFIDLEHSACYAGSPPWMGLSDGEWKYIYFPSEENEQLFNLKQDQGELRDLAKDPVHAATLARWRERLVAHLAERGEPYVKDGKLLKHASFLYSPYYETGYPTDVPVKGLAPKGRPAAKGKAKAGKSKKK